MGILLVINSTLGSSLSSGALPVLQREFDVASRDELALPNSMYLLGYVFGPPLFSPLSEMAGRRIVLQLSFFVFTIFSVASALAPSWPSLIGFRFLAGTFASAPISVVGGLYADLYYDPVERGRAIAVLIGVSNDCCQKPRTASLPDLTDNDVSAEHDSRACFGSNHIWLHLPRVVEMVLLDRVHCCRSLLAGVDLLAGYASYLQRKAHRLW